MPINKCKICNKELNENTEVRTVIYKDNYIKICVHHPCPQSIVLEEKTKD